ncbi:MAG: helix-turn-helix domain-containing protein [Candidatus Woesearchaeota archaeon]
MKKELIDLGLSEKEADLYLICLKTGEVTASRISDLLKLPRSTIYDLLEKLKHNGFITSFVKDKKTYFLANNPEIIIKSIEEKKNELIDSLNNKKQKLQDLIPKLKEIQNQINIKPTAEVFEGTVSISKILDEIAQNAKTIKLIGNQVNAIQRIGYRTDRFRNLRKETKSKMYQILEDSKEARNEKVDKYTEVRFLKSIKDSKEVLIIYNDTTVHIILSEEISAIRIKSKEYTQSKEIIFDELWKIAKKV